MSGLNTRVVFFLFYEQTDSTFYKEKKLYFICTLQSHITSADTKTMRFSWARF